MPNNLKGNLLSKKNIEEKEEVEEEQENSSYYAFQEILHKVMEEQQLYLNPEAYYQ
ncbi:MAG: hypothetical protein ACLUE2_03725 [Bacteroides cellulosilyticus]